MEMPLQNRAENFSSYVIRVCGTIETVRIPLTSEANSFRESKKEKDSRVERVNGKIKVILHTVSMLPKNFPVGIPQENFDGIIPEIFFPFPRMV